MSDLVHLSAGAHRALAHGDNLVDLDAQRRERLRAEFGTHTRIRSRKRAGRTSVDTTPAQLRPTLGRDGPDAA